MAAGLKGGLEISLLIRRPDENDWHEPAISAYENESRLQELIARSPRLLPGEMADAIVAAREVQVPGVGPVDILAVDAAGRIVLVECKLRANPEIRRHVVGQLFAYAAGLWKLPYALFDEAFSGDAEPLATRMTTAAKTQELEWDEEQFRRDVENNLRAGRFRLIFAVDEITDELKRIVEYLNEHSDPTTEILALELGFVSDEGVEILVPGVYGEETARRKARPGRAWNEESFFEALATRASDVGVRAVRRLYDFAKTRGSFAWGSGPNPSVTAWFHIEGEASPVWTAIAWTDRAPAVDLLFNHLRDKVTDERLARFATRLRQDRLLTALLVGLEDSGFSRKPAIPVDAILSQPEPLAHVEAAVADLTGP